MDNWFLHYLYPKQTIKWIWLFGIALAVVLTVQYSELPIFSSISFLLSGARASFLRETYFSYGENKSFKSHDLNDPYSGVNRSIINSEAPLSSKEAIGTKSNSLASNNRSSSLNSSEKSRKNASSLSNHSMDDKKKPKMETLPVMSISQMNELLQKSRSSPNSVVCI